MYEDLEDLHEAIHYIMMINEMLMFTQGHEISEHIGQTLLPLYGEVLETEGLQDRKDYEINDSIGFICDCLQYGT